MSIITRKCPDDQKLAELLADSVEDFELIKHIDQCDSCQQKLEHMSDSKVLETYRDSVRKIRELSNCFDAPQEPGTIGTIDGLTIRARLGSGGMGVVYRGYDSYLDRAVAVKVLVRLHSADSAERFVREAKAAAQVDHPHVVPVYSTGRTRDGRPFLVMPLIVGESLKDRLQRGRIPFYETARIIRQVALGLAAVHKCELIHRDVKPANILLDKQDNVARLTDFGLVRTEADGTLTQQDVICGTPEYMSPGQAHAPTIRDQRNDIYSLGVVLYECLTGNKPFRGQPLDVLDQHRYHEPTPPCFLDRKIPRDLETICLKALEKNPPQRYQTATAFADDLQNFLDDKPVSATRTGPLGKLWRWAKRKPTVAISVAMFFALLLASSIVTTILWRNSEHYAKLARERNQSLLASQETLYNNQTRLADALRGVYLPRLAGNHYGMGLPTSVRNRMMIEMVDTWRLLFERGNNSPEELERMIEELTEVGEMALSARMYPRTTQITELSREIADHLLKSKSDHTARVYVLTSKVYRQYGASRFNESSTDTSQVFARAMELAEKAMQKTAGSQSSLAQQAMIEKFEIQRSIIRLEENGDQQRRIKQMNALLTEADAAAQNFDGDENDKIAWIELKLQICANLAQMSTGTDEVHYRSLRAEMFGHSLDLYDAYDDRSLRVRRDQAVNKVYWALALEKNDKPNEADRKFEEASVELKQLVMLAPLNSQFRADSFETEVLIAGRQWQKGDHDAALKRYRDTFVQNATTLLMNQDDALLHRRTAQVYQVQAQCLIELKQYQAAAQSLGQGAATALHAAKIIYNPDTETDRQLAITLLEKQLQLYESIDDTERAENARQRLNKLIENQQPVDL
jgi:serine/threonine protein kinase